METLMSCHLAEMFAQHQRGEYTIGDESELKHNLVSKLSPERNLSYLQFLVEPLQMRGRMHKI
jgi:hypothetical protein